MPDDDTRSATRRQMLAKLGVGAAAVWAVPIVTTVAASAQAAGSGTATTTTSTTTSTTTTAPPVPACAPSDMSFPTGWVAIQTGAFAPGTGLNGPQGFQNTPELNVAPLFIVEKDALVTTATLTYVKDIVLEAGQTYAFDFQSCGRSGSPIKQGVKVTIDTARVDIYTGDHTGVWTNDHRLIVTPSSTGAYTFRYNFTVVGAGVADDAGVTAPVVTCL